MQNLHTEKLNKIDVKILTNAGRRFAKRRKKMGVLQGRSRPCAMRIESYPKTIASFRAKSSVLAQAEFGHGFSSGYSRPRFPTNQVVVFGQQAFKLGSIHRFTAAGPLG